MGHAFCFGVASLFKCTLNTDVSYLFRVQEDHPIMSFTISKNGRLALLNVATQVSW